MAILQILLRLTDDSENLSKEIFGDWWYGNSYNLQVGTEFPMPIQHFQCSEATQLVKSKLNI